MEGVSKETKRIMAVGAGVVALAAIAAYTLYGKKDAQENIITVEETSNPALIGMQTLHRW